MGGTYATDLVLCGWSRLLSGCAACHVLHEALALQKLTEGSVSAWVCEPEGTMALYELFFVLSLISDSSHRFRLRVE